MVSVEVNYISGYCSKTGLSTTVVSRASELVALFRNSVFVAVSKIDPVVINTND